MAPQNSKQFRKELDAGKIDVIYVFTGEEEGEKEKFINRIIEIVFRKGGTRDYSVGRFHIENDEFAGAVDFAVSQSMFSDRKICVLLNIDRLIKSSKNSGLFSELSENMPDNLTLIMTTSENNPPAVIPASLSSRAKIVQFWRYFDSDMHNYIKKELKSSGVEIDDRAVHLLTGLLGSDIQKVDGALEQIRLSGEKAISPEFVSSFILFDRDISIFEFLDALYKKEKRALALLKNMIENGISELPVLSMISRQAELIDRFHSLRKESKNIHEILKTLRVSEKNMNNFLEYAEKSPPDAIARVFLMISKADLKLKSRSFSRNIAANPIFELAGDIIFQKEIAPRLSGL
jgi:DNA polymerase III subunit delta